MDANLIVFQPVRYRYFLYTVLLTIGTTNFRTEIIRQFELHLNIKISSSLIIFIKYCMSLIVFSPKFFVINHKCSLY